MLPSSQTSALDCVIAEAIARQLQTNPSLGDFKNISSMELVGVIDDLVRAYTKWAAGNQSQVAEYSSYFANLCFRLSIPMVEAAYALFLIRDELTAEGEKPRSKVYPRLTDFFNLVTLDLLERC